MAVVLVAEDDADLRPLLERLFTRAGLTVVAAANGVAALQAAERHEPDVVVTDLDMPGMTGLQLCQALRAHPRLHDVPVAILSGSLLPGDPRAVEARVCEVLLKPVPNADLVAAVHHLIAEGRHDHDADTTRCPLTALTP